MMLRDLAQCQVFQDMDSAELELLSQIASARRFRAGEAIVRQFKPANKLFLITAGSATVRYKPYDGEEITVGHVKMCNVVGWSAVLGHASYTSTVICDENVRVLVIKSADLRQFIANHPEVGQRVLDRLARSVSARWKDAQAQVKSMVSNGHGISAEAARLAFNKRRKKMATSQTTSKESQLQALVEQLSAYIEQFHGGSVEFVDFDGETLSVHLGGACLGCPLSPATLHGWVEGTVRQFFPEIKQVKAV